MDEDEGGYFLDNGHYAPKTWKLEWVDSKKFLGRRFGILTHPDGRADILERAIPLQ